MREYVLYIWIGTWLLLLPFFGIPGSLKNVLVMLTAVFIILYSFIRYRRTYLTEEAASRVVKTETISTEEREESETGL